MVQFLRIFSLAGALFYLILAGGCGGNNGTSGTSVSGKVIAGPVDGATVFADRIGIGVEYYKDTVEVSVKTNRDGSYNMTIPDNYGSYRLISTGGTDTVTGLSANSYITPASSSSYSPSMISPFTTLIAVNAELSSKLKALLNNRDPLSVNPSTDSTSASLFLMKAIDNAVSAILKVTSGLDPQDSAVLQIVIQSNIAAALSTLTVADLAKPASLQTAIGGGLFNAFSRVVTILPVTITDQTATASGLAQTTIELTKSALPLSPGADSYSITDVISESSKFTPANSAAILNATVAVITTKFGIKPLAASNKTIISYPINNQLDLPLNFTLRAQFVGQNIDVNKISASLSAPGSIALFWYNPATGDATFTVTANYFTDYIASISATATAPSNSVYPTAKVSFRTLYQPGGSSGGTPGF